MLGRIASRTSLFALAVAAPLFFQGPKAEAQVTYAGAFAVRSYGTGMYVTDALTYAGSEDVQDFWRNLSDEVYSFYRLSNGSYAIINNYDNMAMTDTGFEGLSLVEQFAFVNSPYQQWDLIPAYGGTFIFYNLGSGKVLTDPSFNDFGALVTYPFFYSPYQLWFL